VPPRTAVCNFENYVSGGPRQCYWQYTSSYSHCGLCFMLVMTKRGLSFGLEGQHSYQHAASLFFTTGRNLSMYSDPNGRVKKVGRIHR
jgi:hypothetical protein